MCVTDKAEASRLPTNGQREPSAGCSLPPTYLPAHQKETQVCPHIHPTLWIMNISYKHPCLPILMCDLLQGGHGGVDGHGGGVADEELWSMSVDGAVPGWTGGTRDDQVRARLPAVTCVQHLCPPAPQVFSKSVVFSKRQHAENYILTNTHIYLWHHFMQALKHQAWIYCVSVGALDWVLSLQHFCSCPSDMRYRLGSSQHCSLIPINAHWTLWPGSSYSTLVLLQQPLKRHSHSLYFVYSSFVYNWFADLYRQPAPDKRFSILTCSCQMNTPTHF